MYMGDLGGNVGSYWFQAESFDEEAFDRMVSTQTEEMSDEKFEAEYLVDMGAVSA
ncbi:ZC3H6 [Symbiodinium microadriaticum]|nr:ZC3H6 [Symbiodinium microadriaticum]